MTPVTVAANLISARRESGRSIPKQLLWVVAASAPWDPHSHLLFPLSARRSAVAIFSVLGMNQFGNVPLAVWLKLIIPFAVSRGPALSRTEANAIWPGDGRSSRSQGIQYTNMHNFTA